MHICMVQGEELVKDTVPGVKRCHEKQKENIESEITRFSSFFSGMKKIIGKSYLLHLHHYNNQFAFHLVSKAGRNIAIITVG